MDGSFFDNEQHTTPDRTRQQETVQAFLEFAIQSSLSSDISRVRSMSCQNSPLLARHSARGGALTLTSLRRPSPLLEPPSPLSPSAISPKFEEVEFAQDVFVEASARPCSYSDPEQREDSTGVVCPPCSLYRHPQITYFGHSDFLRKLA